MFFFPRFYPIPKTGNDFFNIRLKRFFFLKAVENVIKKNRLSFDLIHAHFIHPAGYVALELKKINIKKTAYYHCTWW